MKKIDALFRAFVDFGKQIEESPEAVTERSAIALADLDNDLLTTKRSNCTIDEQWIIAIEEGLVFVQKAIDEGRQFIRTNSEIVPIEKVKRASRDSVEHLARHSDFITRKPSEGADLVPDKLHIVERLSDFAVYENRFLYYLLMLIKDFAGLRFNRISEIISSYKTQMNMDKTLMISKRKISYSLRLTDENRHDEYLKKINKQTPLLNRIERILKTVDFMLECALMQEVCKSPLIKPPIVKTNVLKMNRNFKGAMDLYSYICAYEKEGYTVEEVENTFSPFFEALGNEIALSVMLSTFLSYKNGLGLERFLLDDYFAEEERRKQLALLEQKKRLEELKRRIEEGGGDPFEYILRLEEQNKRLELDSIRLEAALKEIRVLNERIEVLEGRVRTLNETIEQKSEEIRALNEEYTKRIERLNEAHRQEVEQYEQRLSDLRASHLMEIFELEGKHNRQIAQIEEESAKRVAQIQEQAGLEVERISLERDEQIANLKASNKEAIGALSEQLVELKGEYAKRVELLDNELGFKNLQLEQLNEQRTIYECQILGFKKRLNLIDENDDYTSKDSFDQLEIQYNAFKQFFKSEWARTKKKIKDEVLGAKKKQAKQDKQAEVEPAKQDKQAEVEPDALEQREQE